jgi:CheY-like chemotaxis protein
MQGTILLSSKPGEGSKFTVILKHVERGSEENVQTDILMMAEEKIEFHHATVLIADDVESNRELIIGYLDDYDLTIIEAENGLMAVALAEENIPDIILMDLRMPEMDGYDAIDKIKKDKNLTHIPIIVLTASYMEHEKNSSFRELTSGFLVKPVSKSILIKELKKFLKYKVIKESSIEVLPLNVKIEPYHIDSHLKEILNNDFMVEWEFLQKRKPQEKLKSFANKLIALGKENNLKPIQDYGVNLLISTDLFDIANINSRIKEYPGLISNFI